MTLRMGFTYVFAYPMNLILCLEWAIRTLWHIIKIFMRIIKR